MFGLGELDGDKPVCRYFKESATVAFSGNEVLLRDEFCKEPTVEPPVQKDGPPTQPKPEPPPEPPVSPPPTGKNVVNLSFNLPKGKVSGLLGILNFLQNNFDELRLEIHASSGYVTDEDYEDKIKEAFHQMGVEVRE